MAAADSVPSAGEPQKSKPRGAHLYAGLDQKFGRLAAGAALRVSAGANAENFPSKPVHILVPYAAGGAVDVLARTLGQSLAKTWGQQPVIDNRPGAAWDHRIASARAVATGWLHVDPGRERPSAQSVHLSEPALRHLQGLYGDQRDRVFAARGPCRQDKSLCESRRPPRRGAKGPGRAVLRHVRQWHLGARRTWRPRSWRSFRPT